MTDNLYLAQIAYKKIVLTRANAADGAFLGMSVRLIQAKDLEQAKKRLEKYWQKEYKGFVMVKLEIYQALDSKYD
jgi:hypothetical protein